MRSSVFFLHITLVSGTLACGSEAGSAPRGMTSDSADLRVVENRESRWGPGQGWTVQAEPHLIIGESPRTDGVQLVNVSDATRLSDGRIVVADLGTRSVSLYRSGGSLHQQLGGRGSGPGEFESPASLTRLAGDTVAVWDSQLFRVSRFAPSGELVDVTTLDLGEIAKAVEPPLYPGSVEPLEDGTFLVRLTEKTTKVTSSGVYRPRSGALRVSVDLSVLDTVAFFGDSARVAVDAPFGSWPVTLPLGPTTVLAHGGPGNRICVGDQEEPEIGCSDARGSSRALLRWQARPRPLTEEEVASWREANLGSFGQKLSEGDVLRMLDQVPIPSTAPPYQDIVLDEAGNVWVEIGSLRNPGPGDRFDESVEGASRFEAGAVQFLVFGRDGVLLGAVPLPRMEILEIGNDYVLGIRRDVLGVQSLRVHALHKPIPGDRQELSLESEANLAPRASGGQVADTAFRPEPGQAAFPLGTGPRILLDEAHNNFHTADGRYQTAVRVLRQDGFRVDPLREPFTEESLSQADLLIIANALGDENVQSWRNPTTSAFSPEEVRVVKAWVEGGGALLLIADHMPFPGAAAELAAAFGARFLNGFATDSTGNADTFTFRRTDGTLVPHPVSDGRGPSERVDSAMSFTGQAFHVNPPLEPILRVPEGTIVLLPEEAWRFTSGTPVQRGDGLTQGAAGLWGNGRVALWGEAAMFTAQVSGPERRPMGMNLPEAGQNAQLLLNLVRWLSGD